ncbi:hypothetical protein ACTXQV_79290, partial [Klebsiella pneumoniae]
QVAAGQLHHHFTSIGELKAQVFIRLWREGQVLADSDPDIKAAYLLTIIENKRSRQLASSATSGMSSISRIR